MKEAAVGRADGALGLAALALNLLFHFHQGVHFTETLRAAAGPTITLPPGTTSLSASLHSLADVPRVSDAKGEGKPIPPLWSYVFLAPVWPSVSKGATHAPGPDLSPELIAASFAESPPAVPIVALGGLTPANAGFVRSLGFSGAAALGSVWGDPDPAGAWAAFVEGLEDGAPWPTSRC